MFGVLAVVSGLWLASGGDGTAPAMRGARARFATFNIEELSRAKLDQVDASGRGAHPQLRKAAEIVQRVRPDVLLVNEIDFDSARENARLFLERYLRHGWGGQAGLDFPHIYFEEVNTGVPTGRDLDRDGRSDSPGDAFGFGRYPGQYGMALFSRFPLDAAAARSFRLLKWRDLPGHLIPDGREGRPAWYTPDDVALLRLSSKSHWDVPLRLGRTTVHVLAAHPTPPIFDGPEDRNGRRTFDELRLLRDLIAGGPGSDYLVDDQGRRGPLPGDAVFVVMGDLNAEPVKDPGHYGRPAIAQVLDLPRVQDARPESAGGAAGLKPGAPEHPERRTCEFGRIDYVLPSTGLTIVGSGVFWPPPADPLHALVAPPDRASDHRLVWVDIVAPE
jgi:endonuclease/exonuclease/phosphatase family metal-dependent hydrolase